MGRARLHLARLVSVVHSLVRRPPSKRRANGFQQCRCVQQTLTLQPLGWPNSVPDSSHIFMR